MINLTKLAIHEIVKESQTNEATAFITNGCLAINDMNRALVEKLNDSYKSDKIVYAIFDTGDDKYFRTQFVQYNSATDKADSLFLTFTKNVTENLKNQIRHVTLAKGGFLVFVEYTHDGHNYIGVFIVRDTKGVVFNKDLTAHNVQVSSVTYMNTDKLVLACRINLNKFAANDGKYLTFLRRGQAEVSDYFTNWIAAAQPESSKEFTEHLYNMVNGMTLPINPETSQPYELNLYRQKLVSYIKEKNKVVDLHDLGRHFYNNDSEFVDYRDQHGIEIDNEFKADNSTLKKFNLIDLKTRGIQLKFSRGLLSSGEIAIGTGKQVIIRSQELQDALKSEMNSQ